MHNAAARPGLKPDYAGNTLASIASGAARGTMLETRPGLL
jgi:hypothetical protein